MFYFKVLNKRKALSVQVETKSHMKIVYRLHKLQVPQKRRKKIPVSRELFGERVFHS